MLELVFTPLNVLDGLMAGWLSELVRICVWGAAGGAAAMLIYLWTSDQEGIAFLKKETRRLRMQMLKEDLSNSEMTILMKRNLLGSLRFLGKVLSPSLLAAIPVLLIALWIGSFLAYTLPEGGEAVEMDIVPPDSDLALAPEKRFVREGETLRFIPRANAGPVTIMSNDRLVYSGSPDKEPVVYGVYKRQWWNSLIENPAGYINPESGVQEIIWKFPRKVFVKDVPEWLATWEFAYFLSVFVAALVLKVVMRIQ